MKKFLLVIFGLFFLAFTACQSPTSPSTTASETFIPIADSGLDWYATQMGTGYAQYNNCGPTSTFMAIKWFKNGAAGIPTVEDLRSSHPLGGGWWSTDEIAASLGENQVPYQMRDFTSKNDLIATINKGEVAILCLNVQYITYNRHYYCDRFYPGGTGHFIVIKAYSANDDYFVVQDPGSWQQDLYPDGTYMGRNRKYKASDLVAASGHWWPYLIAVGDPGVSADQSPTPAKTSIPVGWARD